MLRNPPPAFPAPQAPSAETRQRWPTAGIRRRLGIAVPGVLLPIIGALAGTVAVRDAAHRHPALEVSAAVSAGAVITAGDVHTVEVSASSTVPLIANRSDVLGRKASQPLVAGTLLTAGMIGAADYPPRGRAEFAVAVKPGQYPSEITVGATACVVITPSAGSATGTGTINGSAPVTITGVVRTLNPDPTTPGGVDISLLTSRSDALSAAADSGNVSVLIEAGGA